MKIKLSPAYSFIKRFRYEIIALTFSAYGMYLRFVCLASREFWCDELCSLEFMKGAFKPFWQRLHYSDYTYFPGDYIINWPFYFFFKENKWGISLPHILLTLLGFYFLYLICKRYLHSIFAWIITFALVAVHRELIFHSFELRPYAVLPTLALAAFYFTEQVISSRYRLSSAQKVGYGLFFIFTLIYHIYGLFILFFTLVYFLIVESKDRPFGEIFKHSYRFVVTIILIGAPLFLWYTVNNDYLVAGLTKKNMFEYVPNPALNLYGFIKSVACNLTGKKSLYFLAVSLFFIFFSPYRKKFQQVSFLVVLVILPLAAIFSSDLLVQYWFLQRQFTWVMPFFAFLIGWCVDSLAEFIQQKIK